MAAKAKRKRQPSRARKAARSAPADAARAGELDRELGAIADVGAPSAADFDAAAAAAAHAAREEAGRVPAGAAPKQDRAAGDEPGAGEDEETPESRDLRIMLGLFWWMLCRMLPARVGGSRGVPDADLTADERGVLGRTWAIALAPYMKDLFGPLVLAAITTVEVFGARAITYASEQPVISTGAPAAGESSAGNGGDDE